jgi:hypothetical protein
MRAFGSLGPGADGEGGEVRNEDEFWRGGPWTC